MERLNARWRGVEAPTDVLSFPQGEGPGGPRVPALLGDVVLNLGEARRQAAEGGESLGEVVERLLVHGILHLAGYDHRRPEEARRMRRKERTLARALREGEGG